MAKFAYRVKNENEIRFCFRKAYQSQNGRQGPVLIDIPMDLQRKKYIERTKKIYSKRKQAKNFSKKINFKNDCKIKKI